MVTPREIVNILFSRFLKDPLRQKPILLPPSPALVALAVVVAEPAAEAHSMHPVVIAALHGVGDLWHWMSL